MTSLTAFLRCLRDVAHAGWLVLALFAILLAGIIIAWNDCWPTAPEESDEARWVREANANRTTA